MKILRRKSIGNRYRIVGPLIRAYRQIRTGDQQPQQMSFRLATLARHKGRPLSHDYLLGEVWGPGYIGETSHIKRYVWSLRRKLEGDPAEPAHILTERGFGYRFA